jgi:phage terminase small subunit
VAKKGGVKRGRNANDEDNAQYEWRWGPRAHAEVGEQGIARFMAEFMVEQYELEAGAQDEEDEEEDEVQETGPSGRMNAVTARKVESAMKGIETAAGAVLSDVR